MQPLSLKLDLATQRITFLFPHKLPFRRQPPWFPIEAGGPSSAVETDTSAPLKTPSTTPLKSTTPAASVGLAAAMLRLPLLVLQHLLLRLPIRPVDAVDVEDRVVESQVAGLILDCAGEVSGKLFTGGY
ncbi:uncharacterized protein PADG_06987 [Paracoccidioides brasiliensis Pb18]|uniref:Uncharacterized protein n=1 Tax=Paracoccidioides brasiliensis (strain Pb18) TaxID=502780 RepID=C1GIA1_PARBD|nr:uncharacterized protein PADG_06987 [Paracoccidioides brasiliensis Pb18]EEH42167.2 hypothetical protein PADG_06987 [Paracoccidioides brasiliensis Pb18]